MENRALLAFVLSLGVFVAWGYILTLIQPPPKKVADPSAQVEGSAQAPSSATSGLSQSGSSQTPAQTLDGSAPAATANSASVDKTFAESEQIVQVTNGLVTYMLSSKGAVIKELFIPRYKDNEGAPINLVLSDETSLYPMTLIASDPEVSNILQNGNYQASSGALDLTPENPEGKIVFQLKHSSGLEVVREYTFRYMDYMVQVNNRIDGQAYADRNLTYHTLWGPGLGGNVELQVEMFTHMGPTTFVNNKRVETDEEDVSDAIRHHGELEWTSFQNKYFGAALIPETGIKSAVTERFNGKLYVGLDFESVQSSSTTSYSLYAGTKELQILEEQGHKLVRLMDYGWMGNKFAFLVKPLLKFLLWFYEQTGNYGWSIILVTCLIKLLFFPLTHKSFKSMKGMMKVQPYIKVIQERNKDDRTKMNKEMMELYQKHRVNPLGGCLPMLLQIPVFIALYHVLFFSIELRGAPFMLWLTDLSEADPYYITPVFMGFTMFLQQKMTPTTVVDPIQQKIMMFLPVIFTFLFLSFPSGLVLYWIVNNLLTIAQQFYIYRIAKD